MKKSGLNALSLVVIMLAVFFSQAGCTKVPMDKQTAAKVMFERGDTAVEAAEQLLSEFGLGGQPEWVVDALKDGGYGCTEIGEVPPNVIGFDAERTARVMKDSGCSSTEVGMILRDALGLDARSAALVLKDLGYDEMNMTEMLMVVYDTFLAIVDVTVTDQKIFKHEEWIGIAKQEWTGTKEGICTQPYVYGLLGTRIEAVDVNRYIRGDTKKIWVRYDLVEATSDRLVLTSMKVTHWPDWKVNCGQHGPGWEPASGRSKLTTKTKGPCWCNGLCVKYSPMSQAETFITDVSLSVSSAAERNCPPLCEANRGYWTMVGDSLDIHKGCGGDYWFLCYSNAKPWPPVPISIDLTPEEKFDLLKKYAPSVRLSEEEGYFPSSVEWAFQHLKRVQKDGKYWLVTKDKICDSATLPWFRGDLLGAPVYAFWVEKPISIQGLSFKVPVADLVYFFYYPYNRGKKVAGTTFGHHVGDWEHVTVRLTQSYDKAPDQWVLKPAQIYLSAHSADTGRHAWDGFSTVLTTHPIVYSASGSHALYPDAGKWNYKTIPVLGKLIDSTSEGKVWNTWERIEAFDYNNKAPLGRYFKDEELSANAWPVWMEGPDSQDCAVADCDPADPASGPIFRWGNPECGAVFGYSRLGDGPTGPKSKPVWTNELIQ